MVNRGATLTKDGEVALMEKFDLLSLCAKSLPQRVHIAM